MLWNRFTFVEKPSFENSVGLSIMKKTFIKFGFNFIKFEMSQQRFA